MRWLHGQGVAALRNISSVAEDGTITETTMTRTITSVRAGTRQESPRVLVLALTLALELGAPVGYAAFVWSQTASYSLLVLALTVSSGRAQVSATALAP